MESWTVLCQVHSAQHTLVVITARSCITDCCSLTGCFMHDALCDAYPCCYYSAFMPKRSDLWIMYTCVVTIYFVFSQNMSRFPLCLAEGFGQGGSISSGSATYPGSSWITLSPPWRRGQPCAFTGRVSLQMSLKKGRAQACPVNCVHWSWLIWRVFLKSSVSSVFLVILHCYCMDLNCY